MPTVLAKSKLDSEHVFVKKRIGCDGIEYQMLNSDFDKNGYLVSEELCLSVIEEHPAHAVHLPMSDCNVEDDIAISLDRAAFLAESSCDIFNKHGMNVSPMVITHNELHFEQAGANRKKSIINMFDDVMNAYPHVRFVIENTTPLRWLQKASTKLSSGYFDSPVLWVKYLRDELYTDRIGTCLDTCHAKISGAILSPFIQSIPNADDIDLSMRSFYSIYEDTVMLFHFASFEESGYGPGHATPYTPKKRIEMENELGLYEEFDCSCPITLEINEKDLLVCDGYAESRRVFQQVWDAMDR